MKGIAIVLIFFLISSVAFTDAIPYTLPDGTQGFFLLRPDVEKCIMSLTEAEAWKKAAMDELTIAGNLQGQVKSLTTELIVGGTIGVILVLASFFVGLSLK